MANGLLALLATVSTASGVALGFGIWWYLLPGIRTVNLPTHNDALLFTGEAPTVAVEVPAVSTIVAEAVAPAVDVEIEVTPYTDEGVVTEVDVG